MSDASSVAKIRAIVTNATRFTQMRLTITADGHRSWVTTFNVVPDGERKLITNPCIVVTTREGTPDTMIKANSPDKGCFEPVLVSNAPDGIDRLTATDVLQVLKTKLSLAHPGFDPAHISLTDEAVINKVLMTPFRLVRGLAAFYEKYGYVNDRIPALKARIATATMRELEGVQYNAKNTVLDVVAYVVGDFGDDERVTDVMRRISLEQEARFPTLSYKILVGLVPGMNYADYNKYVLDAGSTAWAEWSERILITDVEEIMRGGLRKRQQHRKTRRSK